MMKPLYLTLIILAIFAGAATAQSSSSDTTNPKVQPDDFDKIFTKVEIEPCFPGGDAAWLRYLNKNLRIPDADSSGMPATIVVQFIVGTDGKVSDVRAISGPTTGGFREEVVRVVRKSGLWTPAIQNGRQVKAYKKLPVIIEVSRQ
jgi:periplasmic protein TonB